MDDAEVAGFWRKPPDVSPAVKVAVVVAALATAAVVHLLITMLRRYFPFAPDGDRTDVAWLAGAVLLLTAGAAVIAVCGLRAVSWWPRAAIVLAVLQLAILAIVGVAWHSQRAYDYPPAPALVEDLPAHWFALGLGAVVLAAAAIPSRRRGVPLWLRGLVAFALGLVLALGLWLPLAARAVHGNTSLHRDADDLARAAWPIMIGPATLVALAIAAIVTRAARRNHRIGVTTTGLAVAGLAIALLVAMSALNHVDEGAIAIYASYAHVIIAAVLFALCALIALAIAHVRALRSARNDALRAAPWVQTGTVTVDDPPRAVGHVVFQGWLAGFTTIIEAFALRTDAALLPVPAGAHLVAPLDPSSTHARAGDAFPVVDAGTTVVASGFVAPPSDGPFRDGRVPIAGATGLVVNVRRAAGQTLRRDLVLIIWRPCLLFLLATVLAALPAVTIDPHPDPLLQRAIADRRAQVVEAQQFAPGD